MKRTVILLVALLCGLSLWAQEKEHFPHKRTIAYAERDTQTLFMDVYHPDSVRDDRACILYVYGGGFVFGARDNKECQQVVDLLLPHGFSVICIDYRLRLEHVDFDTLNKLSMLDIFKESMEWSTVDCCDAITYICRHAHELDINPAKIVMTGSSAGAITVLQTDYARCNHDPLAAHLPYTFKPAAVVAYSGAIYTRDGKIFYKFAKPAPTCFFHGTGDKIVNYNHLSIGQTHWGGSNYLDKIFNRERYPHWIVRFPKLGHEVALFLPKTFDVYLDFVEDALKGRKTFYEGTCLDPNLKPIPFSKASMFDFYLRGVTNALE